MIQDVDETLRRMLTMELAKATGQQDHGAVRISFDSPSIAEANMSGGPCLNFYLHDVRENLALRDVTFHVARKPGDSLAGRKRASIRLDLSYLVTAYALGDTLAEHRLLADALGILLRNPFIPREYLAGALPELAPNSLLITTAQPDHVMHTNPPLLWLSLGGNLRPALSVVVGAPFDPFDTKWTRVVREAIIGLGQGVPPHGPRRPLDLNSVRVSAAGVVTGEDGQKGIDGVTVNVSGREETAISDERGFFHIANLPPGPLVLAFHKPGYEPQEQQTVAPPSGRPDQLEPLVVSLRALGEREAAKETVGRATEAANVSGIVESDRVYRVALFGKLKYSDGRPAAYIPVRIGSNRSITDGDGVYYFFNLPPGDHKVVADLPGGGIVEVMNGERTAAPALTAGTSDTAVEPSAGVSREKSGPPAVRRKQ